MIKWDGNLIHAIANLGTIPIAKIIRNAARDFVSAGYKATPIAKPIDRPCYLEIWKTPGGWRKSKKIKGKWEKVQQGEFLKWIGFDERKLKSKYVRKHVYGRGWSKASWFNLFQRLGMEKAPKTKTHDARHNAIANAFGDEQINPGWELTVGIGFDHRAGATTQIYNAGFANASKNLVKLWDRELKNKWR